MRRTTGSLTITSSGFGAFDTVNVGGVSVQEIRGDLTITNPLSLTTINVSNDGDSHGRTATHSINTATGIATISGLAPRLIHYQTADLAALNITLGGQSDTFTFANTANATTTLYTRGNNVVNVERTGGPLTINGGPGNDTVNVGPRLADISTSGSGLIVRGGFGFNSVNFDDTAATAAAAYVLQHNRLIHGGVVRASYGVDNLRLNAGNFADNITVSLAGGMHADVNGNDGDDNFFVGTTPATYTALYNGGRGSDTLWAPDGTNFCLLFALDSGNCNGIATFGSVENLVGNRSNDTFHFFNGARLSGFLRDQGGNATLDYSAWTTGVYVNLATAEATNIAGGVSGITNVTGGFGDDILVGDDFGNSLDGGPGRDLLIGGGAGYSGFADFLVGGAGDDILIGGFTAYDTDAGALQAILAEWARTDLDYETRVGNLYSGVGAPALNEETVFYNYGAGNVLLGLGDLDLFFGQPEFDASDWDEESEWFVPVF